MYWECPELAVSPDFVAPYIHGVVQWDDIEDIDITTVYRPKRSEWVNHFTRRRP